MSPKPMSASEYRARAQAKRAERATEIVTLASGSVFELRRPDVQGMVLTGRLPQSLLTEAMAAWKKDGLGGAQDVANKLDDKEIVDSLIFMRDIVSGACVNPKFVQYATADDEIGADDMLPEDFSEIFAWAMGYKGVPGREGLETFPEESRNGSGDSPDSPELQPEAESTPAN